MLVLTVDKKRDLCYLYTRDGRTDEWLRDNHILYQWKYWRALNLTIWLQTGHSKVLAGFIFGDGPNLIGQVDQLQKYLAVQKYCRNLIWLFKPQQPNLIPH